MTDAKNRRKCCTSGEENKSKLRILCLHGYRQNGEVFKKKTGSFRKIVHKWAEFTYITAPHVVYLIDEVSNNMDEINLRECVEADQYGWFFNREDRTYRGIRKGGPAIGFEESIEVVEIAFKEQGPFDGILAFSQGGCFLGLLCDLQQRNKLNFNFDFAAFFSSFKSNSFPHLKYYSEEITLPSLHVFGQNDDIIPTEMSAELRNAFENPVTVIHPGGHYVPSTAEQKPVFQNFFQQRFLHKLKKIHKETENDSSITGLVSECISD